MERVLALALLRDSHSTPEAKASAAAALRDALLADSSLRKPTVEAGALPLLVALLQSGSDTGKANAARLLENFSRTNELRLAIAIADAGAVLLLVALLQSGSDEGKAYAAAALGNLIIDDALCAPIVDAGAVPLLVSLLKLCSDKCKEYAAFALGNLALDVKRCAPIADAGAVLLLVALLQTGSDKGKENAVFALEGLGRQPALRGRIIDCGAAAALAVLCAESSGAAAAAKPYAAARKALRVLCPDARGLEGALVASARQATRLGVEIASRDQAIAALRRRLESLASTVGEKTADQDVTFSCAGGGEIGASRLLLTRASTYYRSLFASMGEGASNVIEPDPDFSQAAHEAVLRQLHAWGEAALPEDPAVLLELLALSAKLRSPATEAGGDVEDVVAHVAQRCEAGVLARLDVSSCLDVLLRFKQSGEFAALVDAAHAVATERVLEVVAQPRWQVFKKQYPAEALELMEHAALAHAARTAAESQLQGGSSRKRARD